MDELTGGRRLLDVGDLEIAHTRTGTAPEDPVPEDWSQGSSASDSAH